MNKIKNILFDLDGTLIESQEGIINSILYSLDKLGITENNVSELNTFIGPPLRNSFTERYHLPPQLAEEAVKYYREYYTDKGIYQNKLYDYVVELLQNLQEAGFSLFVATSKPTVYAEKILHHFKLHNYFIKVLGSNLDNSRTDKTEIIEYVINMFNLDRHQTIMVGDRKHDIFGAKNNSLISIGVTYGSGGREELLKAKADFIVDDCKELESLIKKRARFSAGSQNQLLFD